MYAHVYRTMANINEIRNLFPVLSRKVYGKDLVYLDNAATSQRPQSVIDMWNKISTESNANIHRAVHRLSDEATQAYEAARDSVREFINAESREEIVFTSGTTSAINLVAFSFGETFVGEGDEIAEGGHAVSAAGADIGAGQGVLVQALHILHEAGLLQVQRQGLAHGGGGGRDVLEGSGTGHAGGLLQLLDQLPGVQGIHEVDVAGTAVQDGDGQLAAVMHIQGSGLLIGVAAVLQLKVLHFKHLHF